MYPAGMTDLIEGARGLGLELDAAQCAKLLQHLDLLDDCDPSARGELGLS